MKLLKGQPILFLSLPRHDGDYQSTPWQIASILAKDHDVFFADHPYTILEAIKGFWKPVIRKRIKAYFSDRNERQKNVTIVLLPFTWPLNFLPKGKLYNWVSGLNHRIVSRRLNRFLATQSIDSLAYVNSFDFYFPLLPSYLKARVATAIYHCIDPIIKSFSARHGSYLELDAARNSDAVITTAPALLAKFKVFEKVESLLVPNGVDFEHFSRPLARIPFKSRILKDPKSKIVGYLGNIERRIDYDLLLDIIEDLPDWTLVMAGPVEHHYVPEKLKLHPRVYFTGPIPYSDAPALLHSFDVAIIPFLKDEVSTGIYPLKLFEYLASGKPVVTTSFNEEILKPLIPQIAVEDDHTRFALKIIESFAANNASAITARIELASKNTWNDRADAFAGMLNRQLERKQHVTKG